jgi:hypothetical protein
VALALRPARVFFQDPSNSYLDICAWMVYITTNMTHQPAYTVYFYFYGKPDPAAVGGA